jgi:hypothetical protein
MTTTPAMTQSRMAAPPTAWAAKSDPNSHPEPMIEVSDAQAAPMKPISRFSPVSTGATAVVGASVLLAILDPFSGHAPWGRWSPACRIAFAGERCVCVE